MEIKYTTRDVEKMIDVFAIVSDNKENYEGVNINEI